MSAFRTGTAERRRALIAEFRFRGIVDAAIRATRGFAHFFFSGPNAFSITCVREGLHHPRETQSQRVLCRDMELRNVCIESRAANRGLDRREIRSYVSQ